MRHVNTTVCRCAGDDGEPEQPITYPIVCTTMFEQQTVCGFVHERGKLGMHAAHE